MSLNRELQALPEPPTQMPILPLGHMTSNTRFSEIAQSNYLELQNCKFLGLPMVYTYYGGPAYRANETLSENDLDLPIAMLFSPLALEEVDRIVPFDSGAALSGRYANWENNCVIDKYMIQNDGLKTVPKLVANLFGTNEKYLNGQFKKLQRRIGILGEIAGLYALDLTKSGIDRRKYAIECHHFKRLVISKYLDWIAFPKPYMKVFNELCRHMYPRKPSFCPYSYSSVRDPRVIGWQLASQAKKYAQKYLNKGESIDIF